MLATQPVYSRHFIAHEEVVRIFSPVVRRRAEGDAGDAPTAVEGGPRSCEQGEEGGVGRLGGLWMDGNRFF